ncbi:MAG: Rrf2 family transcriptional regulator [Akkermansiaceae bacterium]|nr:Rrf2 family transcriptional regulator [Akkermansiaceae bacterium]
MRVSQKLDYACRAAVCLTRQYDEKFVMKLEDISRREEISPSFLVQILNEMKRAGLVTSKRGKAGGYLLSRAPASITVLDIVKAIEPALVEIPPDSPGPSGPAVSKVWQGVSTGLIERLQSISIDAIASEASEPMYFI